MGAEEAHSLEASGLCRAAFLLAAVFSFSVVLATPKDTITVDGAVLRLDLDIRESDGAKEGARVRSPWVNPERKLTVWMAGVWTLNSDQGMAIAARAGRPIRPGSYAELAWTWTHDARRVRVGLSGGGREVWTYNTEALDDSLYAVAGSQAGGLEQWIQRTYDLGIELDTLPLPVNRRVVQEARFTLDRGGLMGRDNTWSWWAGVHLNLTRLVRAPSEAERLPVSGRPDGDQVLGPDRSDWVSEVTTGWGMQVGMENKLNREWSWAMRAGWNAGIRSGVWCTVGLACRLNR